MLVERERTRVLYFACADELSEIRAAWEQLEAVVPLRGRRFFGAPALEALAARAARDPSRPEIEHYRRRDEIDVLLPIS